MSGKMCIHWLHFIPMKDVGLRIRIDRDLREQFLKACKEDDKPAAQVLREYMRQYVAERKGYVPMTQVPKKSDGADY